MSIRSALWSGRLCSITWSVWIFMSQTISSHSASLWLIRLYAGATVQNALCDMFHRDSSGQLQWLCRVSSCTPATPIYNICSWCVWLSLLCSCTICAIEAIIFKTCWVTERQSRNVTLRILVDSTWSISSNVGGKDTRHFHLLHIISTNLERVSFRLLDLASILWSSAAQVSTLAKGVMRYASSAYLNRWLPVVIVSGLQH